MERSRILRRFSNAREGLAADQAVDHEPAAQHQDGKSEPKQDRHGRYSFYWSTLRIKRSSKGGSSGDQYVWSRNQRKLSAFARLQRRRGVVAQPATDAADAITLFILGTGNIR